MKVLSVWEKTLQEAIDYQMKTLIPQVGNPEAPQSIKATVLTVRTK